MFDVTEDVYGIDLELFDTGVLGAYVVDAAQPVLVETGHPLGVDRLRAGLSAAGVDPADLAHAVVSHVHIDHSGGVAPLVAENPDLSVYLHESTVEHLLDPTGLTESSRDAMGEHFAAMGVPDPVPAANVVGIADSHTIDAGDRTVELVSTPGHSPDHVSAWDPTSGTLFANEAVGSYYARSDRWLPPATLPNFDVAAVRDSADRLRAFDADRLALSHFGVRPDPDAALDDAVDALATFDRRIPDLYEQRGDLAATERAVRDELVSLPEYADGVGAFEARFQTRGFLHYHGLL
jgi:glyoxylase-like metal-dependent hydrolase (beta-lactamase superfamily II)